MAKKIISEEQKKLNEVKNLYTSQKRKKFNYSPDDLSIDLLSGKWKHKDWKVWMKGAPSGDYGETKEIVKRYIEECKKPYGKRDLSQFHLVAS